MWVIDANPQDIDMIDFVRPDGTDACRSPSATTGSCPTRCSTPAPTPAASTSTSTRPTGCTSTSLDVQRATARACCRTRSPSARSTAPARSSAASRLLPTAGVPTGGRLATCRFPLTNTGHGAAAAASTRRTSAPTCDSDVYRLSAEVGRPRLVGVVPNELDTAEFGQHRPVTVYAKRESGHRLAAVKLTATSESDAGEDRHGHLRGGRPVIEEARLEDVGTGLAPAGPGWFVVNAADAAWVRNDAFGNRCVFESSDRVLMDRPDLEPQYFSQIGFTLAVLEPGKPSGMYHAESSQEDFLGMLGGDAGSRVVGLRGPSALRPQGRDLGHDRRVCHAPGFA